MIYPHLQSFDLQRLSPAVDSIHNYILGLLYILYLFVAAPTQPCHVIAARPFQHLGERHECTSINTRAAEEIFGESNDGLHNMQVS